MIIIVSIVLSSYFFAKFKTHFFILASLDYSE